MRARERHEGQVSHLAYDRMGNGRPDPVAQVKQLWIHGGDLHQSRHYSQFLALQLKARMEGVGTPVYWLATTHHVR
jgi:hypothetical protein